MADLPRRYVTADDYLACRPVYAVWEITLKCDLKCNHCGSRAGPSRTQELSTQEALDVVRQLAELGTKEVTLIGGEAYLRADWIELVRAVTDHGMLCTMTTGGRNLTAERINAAAKAGLKAVSVSIDGLEETHDRIRGVKGSWQACFQAMRNIQDTGITLGNNTQISRLSMREMPELMDKLIDAGSKNWQVQLTVAMGNAVEHPELLLQPYHLHEVMPMLARLYKAGLARDFLMQPGNNIGYFGPYEQLWRGQTPDEGHWIGCNAGQNGIGLEADGTIKSCPSLPTANYAGGDIRDKSLKEIWNHSPRMAFTRDRTVNDLWGFCKTCYYADVCRGGCSWTTHSLFGRPGNNPFCHHRVLELAKDGKRERIVKVMDAEGKSFDHGLFDLVVEPLDAPKEEPRMLLPVPSIQHRPLP